MKFFNIKILPAIGLILLGACTDPGAEIKELNSNELNDVIGTLYIENKQAKSDDSNSTQIAAQDKQEQVPAEPNQTVVDDSDNAETASTINSDIALNTSSSDEPKELALTVDTTNTINDSENEVNISSSDLVDPTAETSTAGAKDINAEKIVSTGFSEPTTVSETQSEIVLKELLTNYPVIDYSNSPISQDEALIVESYCTAISNRLSSVSKKGCLASNHRLSPFKTVDGNPIVVTEFPPKTEREPLGKILVIGGTHGDELTSVSTAYKWISNLNKFHSGLFHWHITPALNADSVLKRPSTRQNKNGVDINRNLPTPDWDKQSALRWEKLSKNIRKNPGTSAASEPETQWIMHEIATFKPDAIVSIHAPYGILDFDSPQLNNAPKNFGRLQLNLLGTYPGSLGNYAGIQRKIPVLTLELPNATAMPSQKELAEIWSDMIKWLRVQLSPS